MWELREASSFLSLYLFIIFCLLIEKDPVKGTNKVELEACCIWSKIHVLQC